MNSALCSCVAKRSALCNSIFDRTEEQFLVTSGSGETGAKNTWDAWRLDDGVKSRAQAPKWVAIRSLQSLLIYRNYLNCRSEVQPGQNQPCRPKKKAARFDGLVIQINAVYLITSPSHKEASLQSATLKSSSSISWSLDKS